MSANGLPHDWILQPAIDLELKRYVLLGYLQRIHRQFAERKLYPYLEELREHLDGLIQLRRTKDDLLRNMGGELLGFDPRTGAPLHERPEEDAVIEVIDEVVDFAIPGLRRTLEEGTGLLEEYMSRIHFEPIGLLPLRAKEGWMLLRSGSEARAYTFRISPIRQLPVNLDHRNVVTRYVSSYTMGIVCTYEHIKADLIDRYPAVPVPACFAFETELGLPPIETFVPLAKRLVHAHLSQTD
jgi:hypothetical protein